MYIRIYINIYVYVLYMFVTHAYHTIVFYNKPPSSSSVVDYDSATTSYDLVIRVSDSTNNVDVPVSVSLSPVNEATPTFSQSPKTISTDEDTAVGTVLDTFVAADSDYAPHAIVSYSMTGTGAVCTRLDEGNLKNSN